LQSLSAGSTIPPGHVERASASHALLAEVAVDSPNSTLGLAANNGGMLTARSLLGLYRALVLCAATKASITNVVVSDPAMPRTSLVLESAPACTCDGNAHSAITDAMLTAEPSSFFT